MAFPTYLQNEGADNKKRILLDLIRKESSKNNIDPLFVESVMDQESRGNPNAVSSAGAKGLMQLMPGTAKELGVKNPFDPSENIAGGTKYLSDMLKKFGSEPLALAAYNSGPGRVEKYGDDFSKYPAETRDYIPKIMTKFGVKKAARFAESPFDTPDTPTISPMQAQAQPAAPKEESPYMEQIRELLKPKKQSKLELIGNLLRGAGGVMASFGNPDHAEEITARLSRDMNLRQGTKAAELKNLLDVIKLDKEGRPSSVKEYEYYANQETKAGRTPKDFFNWQIENKQAGAMNPLAVERNVIQREALGDKREENVLRRSEAKAREDERREKDLGRATERLSGKLGNLQDLTNTFGNIEEKLGFSLDEYDPKTGTARGKKVDLPGVSVPGVGRVSFYSRDARELNNIASKLFNLELKDRSGAAITSRELENLKDEFSAGRFNNETEMLGALKRYKIAVGNLMQNIESGFQPEALEEYRSRGGVTSRALRPPQTGGASSVLPPPQSSKQVLTDRQKTLLQFAKDNPNAPESKEILDMLGGN